MHRTISALDRARPVLPLVLRLVLGGIFLWHGIKKFDGGISMVEGAFSMWGVPAPELTAPLTAIVEIVAGIMLVVGLGTRFGAAALALIMIGALVYVKADLGIISGEPMPDAELDLALLAGLVAVMVLGPGRLSLDQTVGIEPVEAATSFERMSA